MKRNLEKEALLTQKRLKELFRYEDGKLFWKVRPRYNFPLDQMKKPAGCLRKTNRYWYISINGKQYLRGRLIFFMHKGFWPSEEVDHINRIRTDDRIENLVASNRSENAKNTKGRSNTGWKHIHKANKKSCKQGFWYVFSLKDKGKFKTIKASTCLDKLVAFRNGYLQRFHPDKLAICNRHDC